MKNLKSKLKNKQYMIAFFIIIAFPLIQITTHIFPKGNLDEKREKKPLPDIKNFENMEDYFKSFEDYYNDNFGFRSSLINLKSNIDLKLFKESSNSDVILGKDDYLFFKEEIDDYNGKLLLSDGNIDKIAKKLKLLQDNLKARGQDFIFTIAPNKSTIYPEYLKNPNSQKLGNLDKLQSALDSYGVNYVDLKELMLNNKDNYELYYKRDTHWNPIASTLAGNAILKKINNFYGTNYSLEPTNLRKDYYHGDLDSILGIDSKIPEWQCDYTTTGEKNKLPKTLFYADSFGGPIQTITKDLFNQQIDLHSANTYLEDTYPVFSQNNKLVIFEIVERNINKLLDYNFDIFDNPIDGFDNLYTSESLDLNESNPNIKLNDVAYSKIKDNEYFLSTRSDNASIEFNVKEGFSPEKLYLDLNEVKEPTVITLYWAKDDESYSDERSLPIKLISSKTKYVIDGPAHNINGTWLKIKISDDINKNLNINNITMFNKK